MKHSGKNVGQKKRSARLRDAFSVGAWWTAAARLLAHRDGEATPPQAPPRAHPPAIGFSILAGRVIDGYVRDATVFYDADGNGLRDAGESFAVTDDQGRFTLTDVLRSATGRIVVEAGGIDIETGQPVGLLLAPDTGGLDGPAVVSPLTLLVTLNPWLNPSDLKAVLGIPESVDLLRYDPIAEMAGGGAAAATAQAVFSAQQQVYAVVQAAAHAQAGGGEVDFAALQTAVTAVGAAIGNGAATLGEVGHAVLGGIVADPVAAARIEAAVNDSVAAIAAAYATPEGGMALSDARALVAAADPGAAGFDEAVTRLASARAAASVSQDALLSVVDAVSAGAAYTPGDLQPFLDTAFQGYQEQLAAAPAALSPAGPAGLSMAALAAAPADAAPIESVSAHYRFTDAQIEQALPQGDAAFDALLSDLQLRGLEVLDLAPDQAGALAGAGFSLIDGIDVAVTGTGFLHGGGVTGAALSALLAPADTTVYLTGQNLGEIVAAGDPAFDDLVGQLQRAGMDHLSLDNRQIGALADAGFTLADGVDVSVTGTGFLQSSQAGPAAVAALLAPADVTVSLTNRDMGRIIAGGDPAFDDLIGHLQQSGMDHLALSGNQIAALADAGFSLIDGVDVTVTVTGTGFLHGAGTGSLAVGQLLGAADTTVHLSAQDLGQVLADGDVALDALMAQLRAAGMDHLALDSGQVGRLADAHFSFDAGTDITVEGTGFLHGGGSHPQDLATLLGDAHVAVDLTAQDLQGLLTADDGAGALGAVAGRLHDAGVDTLALSADQAVALAQALGGVALDDLPLAVSIADPLGLGDASAADLASLDALLGASDTTADLRLGELRQAGYGTPDDLQQAMDGLQHALAEGGIDHIDLSDELAHALAQANIAFLPSAAEGGAGQDIVVTAGADDGAGTAYLEASLQQMQALGVDEVTVAAGVQKVEVAFGDGQGTDYSLDDLPHFQVAAGTEVGLVVTEDDLAHLLQQGGAFDQLAELGVTDLLYTGDTDSAAYQDASAASAVPIEPVTLTPVEVQLLGLGEPPADPMDPFHKPA
ncbi:hypothetical protein GN316_18055 [Xylophilus sp. Kf1]|nr:hypothetical protein [Xylophilus sp. Kf1]